jgi:DNA-directed RNA polymerase specialized sigma24 family protein
LQANDLGLLGSGHRIGHAWSSHGLDLAVKCADILRHNAPRVRTPEESDLDLVQALQAGEDRALDALMDRHREGLFRFVFRQIRNESDALELTMEAFVRAYFSIGKFRPTAKFATWLYHIALNLCRDHAKSKAYQYSLQTVSFDAPTGDDHDGGLRATTERRPD